MTFTTQQLENWRRYEAVRQRGRFNMYDPRARQLTELSGVDYGYCMKHYSELQAAAQGGQG